MNTAIAPNRFARTLAGLAFLLVSWGAAPLTARAAEPAPELKSLLSHAEAVRVAHESYAEASAKSPNNAGARRLSIKLDGLNNDLAAYLLGKADQSLVMSRIQEVLTEAKRYKTSAQAKALVKTLNDAKKDLLALPRRLSTAEVAWVKNQSTQTEVAMAEPKATPLPADPAEAKLTETKPTESTATDATASPTETAEAPSPEAYTQTADAESAEATEASERPRQARAEASPADLPIWLGWALFGLVVFTTGLLAAVWAQGRQIAQLRQQVEDGLIAFSAPRHENHAPRTDESLATLRNEVPLEMNHRWEALQSQTADFARRIETRFANVEATAEALSEAQRRMSERLVGFEALETTVGRLDLASRPKAMVVEEVGTPAPAEVPVVPAKLVAGAGPLATAQPALQFHPTDREQLVQLLDQLQASTTIEALRERARGVMEGYQSELSPDPVRVAISAVELAELAQLAYLSTLAEDTKALYQPLTDLYKREQVLVEDKMIGRMAFSDYYADNFTVEQLREQGLPTSAAASPVALPQVIESVQRSPLEKVAVKGTVLYTLLPTVLRQVEGVKAVLRRGVYVIKG